MKSAKAMRKASIRKAQMKSLVKKNMFYFHITPLDNLNSILESGLKKLDSDAIYVFNELEVTHSKSNRILNIADDIAILQLGLVEYALLIINSDGITGEIQRDDVGEFVSGYHRRIIQDTISPEYIRLLKVVENSDDIVIKHIQNREMIFFGQIITGREVSE